MTFFDDNLYFIYKVSYFLNDDLYYYLNNMPLSVYKYDAYIKDILLFDASN